MFNQSTFSTGGSGGFGFGSATTTPQSANPMKDFEVRTIKIKCEKYFL